MAQQDSKDNFVIEALNQFTRLRGLAMTGDTAALHREIDAMADDDLRCMVYTLAAFRLEDEGGTVFAAQPVVPTSEGGN